MTYGQDPKEPPVAVMLKDLGKEMNVDPKDPVSTKILNTTLNSTLEDYIAALRSTAEPEIAAVVEAFRNRLFGCGVTDPETFRLDVGTLVKDVSWTGIILMAVSHAFSAAEAARHLARSIIQPTAAQLTEFTS